MKALFCLLIVLIVSTSVFALDVIVKQKAEFRFEISPQAMSTSPVAEKKIRNYLARRGYIVDNISLVQSGSGATPWLVDVKCFYNVYDFRNIPADEVQEQFKDRNDIDDVILDN